MSAPFDLASTGVEQADLRDPALVAEIDGWVQARTDSTPFHRPGWIMAVARATGQKAVMLVARDGAGGIAGLVPLTVMRSLLFGRALVSSGFAVDGGILADSDRTADALADGCWALAGRFGCTTAELRGGRFPSNGWAVKSDAYLGFSGPLAVDDDAQLASIQRRHRAEVRKGLNNGLAFEIGRDRRLLDIHYALYARSVHRLGTPVFPKALFARMLDAFGTDADIAIISKDGDPLSSVLTLYHGSSAMPYWHGAVEAARTMRSNDALYFRLMGSARERGFARFDFGRSKVGTGPAAWKRSWGFEGVPLSYAVRTAEGREARDINPLSPQYQRKVELWKKLPLPLANFIGPHIARGLG